MSYYIYATAILALCLSVTTIHAQIDTTLRDYFPLHEGDVWEYEIDEYPAYPHYQIRNLGDSLLPNGKIYFHLFGSESGFYRMDSLMRVFRYAPEYATACSDSEFLVYDLSASDREIWESCIPPQSTDSSTAFIGLHFTRPVLLPLIGTSFSSKQFCEAQVDSNTSDTSFCPLVPRLNLVPRRLSKEVGLSWFQFEGPATNLYGAIIDGVLYGSLTSVVQGLDPPRQMHLSQNYPNPFNPSTKITYALPVNADVNIEVYDILGRVLLTLVNEPQTAGYKSVEFDTPGFPSGIYFYRLRSGGFVDVKKMALIR